ncbi:hypothetical protein CC78DRAFT_574313 [Lojkania enalia]|uniref:Ubiquitin 3 binding protein But2 C-terminal domain-containing protein n=1 Tax=Lojkania enalia TaxID=147567 RepID=A0A9P4NBQ6_9PLEO|nr:hypothetical protein CC78DRAFT_574313 [Didymosphaeria enalia]
MLTSFLIIFVLLVKKAIPSPASPLCSSEPPTPATTPSKSCQIAWATEIHLLNSRYPNITLPESWYNMVLRTPDTEVVTQIQFDDIPANASECQLELYLPETDMMTAHGPNPVIDIRQVSREPSAPATYETFVGHNTSENDTFGSLNLSPPQVRDYKKGGNRISINRTPCNKTLTFQVSFATPGEESPNYWGFVNVNPPYNPFQGWRITHSC